MAIKENVEIEFKEKYVSIKVRHTFSSGKSTYSSLSMTYENAKELKELMKDKRLRGEINEETQQN